MAAIAADNVFGFHFNVIFFMVLSKNGRELPNNQNVERDPLRSLSQNVVLIQAYGKLVKILRLRKRLIC